MRGTTVWHGHPTLSRPITILGVERKWFMLSATFAMGAWNAMGSLVTGGMMFGIFYLLGILAWKRDPAMLQIIKATQTVRVRYDPGKPTRATVEVV